MMIADDMTCTALRALIDDVGEVAAASQLAISRQTLARALAALPVHRGTMLAIRTALAANDTATAGAA